MSGLVAVATASPASAASSATCDLTGTTLTVAVVGSGFSSVSVSGTAIVVTAEGVPVTCTGTPATTANVDTIAVTGDGDNQVFTLDQTGGPFAPGASPEGSIPEIEFTIDLGGGTDQLAVTGTNGDDHITFGSTASNLNDDGDIDLAVSNIEGLTLDGGNGNDFLSADGGAAQGGPVVVGVKLVGGDGNDILAGGSSAGDVYLGGNGDDDLRASAGSDSLDGGPDTDTASYFGVGDTFGGGVDVDLMRTNRTGSALKPDGSTDTLVLVSRTDSTIENIVGTNFADTISGDNTDNVILGRGGNDKLKGGDGTDTVQGNNGNDTVFASRGNDSLDAGTGIDTLDLGGFPGGGVTVDLQAGTVTGTSASDTLVAESSDPANSTFENVKGTAAGESLLGDDDVNALNADGGNDFLDGRGAADALTGGAGTDTCVNRNDGDVIKSCENLVPPGP